MREHERIPGVLYVVMGGLYLLGAVVLATLMTGTGLRTGDLGDAALVSGIGVVIALVLGSMGHAGLVVGRGLLKGASWSRIPALILGFLDPVNFPLGTLLGGHTIWAIFQPEAQRLLSAPRPGWEP